MDHVRLGRAIRLLRQRRGWRQVDLADRADVPRSTVWKLELGRAADLGVGRIEKVARALEARVDIRLDWRGAETDRLLDSAHASLVDAVVRLLTAAGWLVETEVSFEVRGERGSIDVLAWHPGARLLLVVEVKSAFGDLQATLMVLDRKVRLGPIVARRFGWSVSEVGRLLVVGESGTTRRVVATHQALFQAAFPYRGRAVLSWLRAPGQGRPEPGTRQERFSGLLFSPAAPRGGVTGRRRVRRVRERPAIGARARSHS